GPPKELRAPPPSPQPPPKPTHWPRRFTYSAWRKRGRIARRTPTSERCFFPTVLKSRSFWGWPRAKSNYSSRLRLSVRSSERETASISSDSRTHERLHQILPGPPPPRHRLAFAVRRCGQGPHARTGQDDDKHAVQQRGLPPRRKRSVGRFFPQTSGRSR